MSMALTEGVKEAWRSTAASANSSSALGVSQTVRANGDTNGGTSVRFEAASSGIYTANGTPQRFGFNLATCSIKDDRTDKQTRVSEQERKVDEKIKTDSETD